jgi:hypothetical protein
MHAEHRKAIALAQAKEKIRALYALFPLCGLHCHYSGSAHQAATWIHTYCDIITAISQKQQGMNQNGQMGISQAFKCLYSIEHLYLHTILHTI